MSNDDVFSAYSLSILVEKKGSIVTALGRSGFVECQSFLPFHKDCVVPSSSQIVVHSEKTSPILVFSPSPRSFPPQHAFTAFTFCISLLFTIVPSMETELKEPNQSTHRGAFQAPNRHVAQPTHQVEIESTDVTAAILDVDHVEEDVQSRVPKAMVSVRSTLACL